MQVRSTYTWLQVGGCGTAATYAIMMVCEAVFTCPRSAASARAGRSSDTARGMRVSAAVGRVPCARKPAREAAADPARSWALVLAVARWRNPQSILQRSPLLPTICVSVRPGWAQEGRDHQLGKAMPHVSHLAISRENGFLAHTHLLQCMGGGKGSDVVGWQFQSAERQEGAVTRY